MTTQPPPSHPFAIATEQFREIENAYGHLSLMKRAGEKAASRARELIRFPSSGSAAAYCEVLCGPGNNGGDGLTAALILKESGFEVEVVAPVVNRYSGEARDALEAWRLAGGDVLEAPEPRGVPPSLIIDAIFGIGLSRAPAAPFDALIRYANERRKHDKTPVLALDMPSGVGSDTGFAWEPAIHATETLHFIAYQPGAFTCDGPDCCGFHHLATLDLPEAAFPDLRIALLNAKTVKIPEVLFRNQKNTHKGTFGTLGIVGGNAGMQGAALIAGRAAHRMGAGKVHIGFIGKHPAVDLNMPELMLRDAETLWDAPRDAWVVGCGLGLDAQAEAMLDKALAVDAPLLLDADALTLLAYHANLEKRVASRSAPTLMTPHPAEAARLLRSDTKAVNSDRIGAAYSIARTYKANVLLKGQGTAIVSHAGEFAINTTGCPALSFAGSGDTLSGMVGALLAQGVEPLEALRFAACLHGAAADELAREDLPFGQNGETLLAAARKILRRRIHPFPFA